MAISSRSVLWGLVVLAAATVIGTITFVGWEAILGPRRRPTTDRKFPVTAERLARGKYLVEGPGACFHCHTEHDFSTPAYPIVTAKRGGGWELPLPELGTLAASNITPDPVVGLGTWTDDEIARAIREGVARDGTALFPVMDYPAYARMDEGDVEAIVVYVRTIAPVKNNVPRRRLIFPLNLLVNTMPMPLAGPVGPHPASTPVERGRYLATIAGCPTCHTPIDSRGRPMPGLAFAGGAIFHDPGQAMKPTFSLNITHDPSGIAHYDEAFFIDMIRTGRVAGRVVSHIMPLESFKNMTDEDLRDIWAYLQAQPPVRHRISNTDPPADCPVCGQRHGLGNLNTVQKTS